MYIIIVISVVSFIIFSEELNVDRISLYRVFIRKEEKEENILNVSEVSNITHGIFT